MLILPFQRTNKNLLQKKKNSFCVKKKIGAELQCQFYFLEKISRRWTRFTWNSWMMNSIFLKVKTFKKMIIITNKTNSTISHIKIRRMLRAKVNTVSQTYSNICRLTSQRLPTKFQSITMIKSCMILLLFSPQTQHKMLALVLSMQKLVELL